MTAGWVLIRHEDNEFYGQVEWMDESGNMTGRKETVERWYVSDCYRFIKSGMGELVLVKKERK